MDTEGRCPGRAHWRELWEGPWDFSRNELADWPQLAPVPICSGVVTPPGLELTSTFFCKASATAIVNIPSQPWKTESLDKMLVRARVLPRLVVAT